MNYYGRSNKDSIPFQHESAERFAVSLMEHASFVVKKLEAAHGGNSPLFAKPILFGHRYGEQVADGFRSRYELFAASMIVCEQKTNEERIGIELKTFGAAAKAAEPEFADFYNGRANFALAFHASVITAPDETATSERSVVMLFADSYEPRNNIRTYNDSRFFMDFSKIDNFHLAKILTECQRLQAVLKNYNQLQMAA